MYKHVVIGLITLILPVNSFSETAESNSGVYSTNLPIVCTDVATLTSVVKDKFNELSVFLGETPAGAKFVLTSNIKTKTWTAFFYKDDIACILGTGTGFNAIPSLNTKLSNKPIIPSASQFFGF